MMLLGWLGWLGKGAQALLNLAARYPWQAALITSLCLSAWLWHGKGKAIDARDAEIASHRQTKADYRTAQAVAKEMETERLVRVEKEQQEITDAALQHYNVQLAAARAKYERLRESRAIAARAPGGEPVSDVPVSSPGIDPAPDDFGLSARLVATGQALQLDALISWVERQAAVDPNDQ